MVFVILLPCYNCLALDCRRLSATQAASICPSKQLIKHKQSVEREKPRAGNEENVSQFYLSRKKKDYSRTTSHFSKRRPLQIVRYLMCLFLTRKSIKTVKLKTCLQVSKLNQARSQQEAKPQ